MTRLSSVIIACKSLMNPPAVRLRRSGYQQSSPTCLSRTWFGDLESNPLFFRHSRFRWNDEKNKVFLDLPCSPAKTEFPLCSNKLQRIIRLNKRKPTRYLLGSTTAWLFGLHVHSRLFSIFGLFFAHLSHFCKLQIVTGEITDQTRGFHHLPAN